MPDYIYLLKNRLSPAQQRALHRVRETARGHGMTVFLTGGAVRDLTTGFPVRDLDFSVQGNALKLKKSLEKAGAAAWGEHEPSRTLFLWFPGVRVEVSSTRSEEFPKPAKPVYHWASMLEDLRRRDFTANAMAISLNEGSYGLLLDPLNGIADLEARTLRLVSSYGFLEDPSRMLRAVRLQARTGWEMDERTRTRYQNARDEDVISSISPYLKGYELEEIAHEEDALKALKALEAEGWMKHLYPAWTSAKADVQGLEALHQTLIKLLIQGISPDLSAAQMELLTAKLAPKELAALKKMFPRPGFVAQWEKLEESAKELQKELLDKKNAAPSATWQLLTSYAPEATLWLAYTSRNAQVQARFQNFYSVWPEARQKVPTALMQEMRITPELPGYQDLLQQIFFQLIDEKLTTDEEMRAFLAPHSPPAPPPPVTIRRTRVKKAERARLDEEESDDTERSHRDGEEEDGHRVGHDEDHEEREDHDVALPPAVKAKPVAAKKAAVEQPQPVAAKKAGSEAPKPAPHKATKPEPAKPEPAKPDQPRAKVLAGVHEKAAKTAPAAPKPAAVPAKQTPPAKPAGKAPSAHVAAKSPARQPAKSLAKSAAKSAAKTAAKSAAKTPPRKQPPTKKPAKPPASKRAKAAPKKAAGQPAKHAKKPTARPIKKPLAKPAVKKTAAKASRPVGKKR
jgi:tRNA nucleotidyltransferase (CCA-adding enzyme)